ncbi:unnamed protein product [Phyllotreta striolata]|uniref:F-box domain-containing protein n=1 Tax=Phyllotreta striolata TaxID=444603 RepID=A0A9N9XPA3_PHYSR|nr:unnamed protein product [Phyllotreta striolata]
MLPREIIERILIKCDGRSLLNARKVDENWKDIVDYLTDRTRIWEWCCKEEIPANELIDYLQQHEENEFQKWLNIYINWYSWQTPSRMFCDTIPVPLEMPMPTLTSIAVSRNFIAVGSRDGRISIFTAKWKKILVERILAVRINSLTFLESTHTSVAVNITILVHYEYGLYIFFFDGFTTSSTTFHDVVSYSVYKNYICYEKVGGRMTIAKLVNNGGKIEFEEIWFSRIYSPSNLSCMKMWEGVCTFLINNEVKIYEYGNSAKPVDMMKKKTKITFINPLNTLKPSLYILRNDIIVRINCSRMELNDSDDLIEFFLLSKDGQCSKKVFSPWQIFYCFITCIYLYGNTLVLGTDTGIIYIYNVSHWKNLDLRKYDYKFILGQHPIIGVNVKETKQERRFYVLSPFAIHEVYGYLPNVY